MKWKFAAAALALMISQATHAQWLVGLTSDGNSQPSNAISVFERSARGDTSPVQTVGGPLSGFKSVTDFLIDETNHQMLVADFFGNRVVRFNLDANGDPAPLATISNVHLTQPRAMAAIPGADELAILASSVVMYLPLNASTGTPIKRLSFMAPSGVDYGQALIYLPETDEIAVADHEQVGDEQHGEIRFFSRLDQHDMTATRVVSGPLTRLGEGVLDLQRDPIRREWYALVHDAPINLQYPCRIVVFPDAATGNVAPIRELAGPATLLLNATTIQIDPVSGELAVGTGFNDVPLAVLFFNRDSQGNTSPIRQISGPATGLSLPRSIGALGFVPIVDAVFASGFE